MNTDAELEQALLGTWKSISDRAREPEEFTFKPGHAFTGCVGANGVWGYWDIKKGQFRMGPTADQVEQASIRLDGNEILVTSPNGTTQPWLRKT